MSSLGNISENPHVGLLVVDFTEGKIGLHVNGRARIVENDAFLRDPSASEPIREDILPATGSGPERWVVVSAVEAYVHCSKHIPRMQKIDEEIQWGLLQGQSLSASALATTRLDGDDWAREYFDRNSGL